MPNAVEYSTVSNDSANRLYVLPISIVAILGEFLFGVDGGGGTVQGLRIASVTPSC